MIENMVHTAKFTYFFRLYAPMIYSFNQTKGNHGI